MKYIFESPDKGKTIYRREFGNHDKRELIKQDNMEMMSLYDYLGRAAGPDLGKQVAIAAAKAGVKGETRQVSNPVYRASQMWTKLALAGYILRGIGDGMEMAHSIEGRPPFLDHKLFTYCTQLPISQKIHNGIEKHILRESMKNLLPTWLYNRPKHPFVAPPIHLFSTPRGNEMLQDTLRSHWLDDIPFVNPSKVRTHLDKKNRIQSSEAPLMLILSAVLMQKCMSERGTEPCLG